MSGRVVVVTGASAGIGRAIARQLGQQGDKVGLLARDEGRLDIARKEIEAAGGRAVACPVDVSDADAVEAAASAVEEQLGPIDVWINVAMSAVLAPVRDTSAEEFRRVTEVTYLGYVHGTLAALKRMSTRDRGVIVQVSSGLAQRAIPLQATYCAAKHAIRGFTRALRCELLHDKSGVQVAMVDLPGVNTPQFGWVKTTLRRHPRPVAPVYQPEVAARAVLWAVEHPRAELMVGAITPAMIWADRIAPGLVDRYLARTNIDAQQMPDKPIDPDRPSYLWEPVPGDVGAHGIFDDEAKDSSAQLWLTTHRRQVGLAALCASAVAGPLWRGGRRRRTR